MVRRRRIAEHAKTLLRQFGVVGPPVPVERIARALGAEVRFAPHRGTLSGALYRDGGRVVIGVNALHPKTRQRFTIAHELGHLLLHQTRSIYIDQAVLRLRDVISETGLDPQEVEANAFAAELLMPREWLEKDLQGKEDLEDEEVVALAKRYEVSIQALTIRLQSLGYVPM